MIKQRLKRHYCLSIDKLKEAIQEEWQAIDQMAINKLVETMLERLKECWKRGGLNTP